MVQKRGRPRTGTRPLGGAHAGGPGLSRHTDGSAIMVLMSDEQPKNPFEEALRAMARDLQRSIDQVSETDWEGLARANGLDPDRARQWLDQAGGWLRGQAGAA